ncbi:MAG: hypothetical protein ABFC89_12255 [Methanospirillum sp.]
MSGRTTALLLFIAALAVVLVAACSTAVDLPAPFPGPVIGTGSLSAVSQSTASTVDGGGLHIGADTANFASSPPLAFFTKGAVATAELNAAPAGSRVVAVKMRNSSADSTSRFVLIGGDVYFIQTSMTAPQFGFVTSNATSPVPTYAGLGRSEHQFYRDQVATGRDRVVVDLDWGDSTLDPTLTVYPPDGALGTYHDGDDGRMDGRIYLDIAGSGRLTPGEWYYRVTGDGSRDLGPYSFTIT